MEYPYIKIINIDDKSYIYDGNIDKIALLPEFIKDINFKFTQKYIYQYNYYNDLIEKGFFSSNRIKKILNQCVYESEDIINSKLERLTLQLTNDCVLKCKYCYYSTAYNQEKAPGRYMNEEIALKSIHYFLEHSKETESINISFYGGEPLLHFSLIKKCISYINQKKIDKRVNYYITTSLTIINDEILEFLIEYDFNMVISLDGPEKFHNNYRIFKNNKGSYDTVISNLNLIKGKYPKYFEKITFNAVILDNNHYIDYKNFFLHNKLFQTGEKLNDFVISPLYDGIEKEHYMRIMKDINKGENIQRKKINSYKESLNQFKEFLLSFLISQRMITIHNENIQVYNNPFITEWLLKFDTVQRGLNKQFFEEDHPIGPCYAGKTKLLVDCDGNYWPCEKVNTNNLKFSIGNVSTGILLDKVNEMLNISQSNEKECINCWAFRYCGQCIANVTSLGREVACEYSKSDLENNLYYYCRINLINNKYSMNLSKKLDKTKDRSTNGLKEQILNYLREIAQLNIDYIDSLYFSVEKAFFIYEIILIITKLFHLNVKDEDIINYKNISELLNTTIDYNFLPYS